MAGGNILTALGAAGSWGVGDFAGGMGVRLNGSGARGALRFIVLTHTLSLAMLLTLAFAGGAGWPHGAALAWGLAAGVVSAGALCAFYLALNRGAMGVSAAVSGLLTAAIPAAVSSLREGSPDWQRMFGFGVAGLAIWLIAAGPGARAERVGVALATLAGAGFGLYFVALKFASASGPVWTMATARMGSIATGLLLLGLLGGMPKWNPSRAMLAWVLMAAVFDTAGNVLFVAATRGGRLDVAAVLAALYPAPTILLAAWRLGERLTRRQVLGLGVAVLAVVLVV